MKTFACVGLAVAVVVAAAALAADRDQVYSSPPIPPREALDRLNLRLAWSAFVQCDGRRDGLASVQLAGRQLLVQTRSGLVTALDAENGCTLWRNRVGLAYARPVPLGFNRKSVFVVNGTDLYGLDRETGAKQWQISLPNGVSVAPVAGEYQLYVSFGNTRMLAYLLPRSDQLNEATALSDVAKYVQSEDAASGGSPGTFSAVPVVTWEAVTRVPIEWVPVLGPGNVLVTSPDGELSSWLKFPKETRDAVEIYHYKISDDPVLAQPGHYENMAYIGSRDSNVYAVDIDHGNVAWRYASGGAVRRQPIATEKDVYVVSDRLGMARIDRATGSPLWRLPRGGVMSRTNADADRFLAANAKFVYATDPSGRLLVLDRATGLKLSSYEGTRDYTVPLSNEANDRIYLAAHNGLIVCLHDREYATPFRHIRGEERSVDPKVAEVEAKLAKLITDEGKEATPLNILLKTLLGEKNGNIKYLISENAFKEAGASEAGPRLVSMPKVTNVALGEVLRRVLAQVDATYRVIEDTIVIYPAPRKSGQ
jgi:outer membrane protein assembly factor BamB